MENKRGNLLANKAVIMAIGILVALAIILFSATKVIGRVLSNG